MCWNFRSSRKEDRSDRQVVPGEKIAELLMEDVKGVVLNPLGVECAASGGTKKERVNGRISSVFEKRIFQGSRSYR